MQEHTGITKTQQNEHCEQYVIVNERSIEIHIGYKNKIELVRDKKGKQ